MQPVLSVEEMRAVDEAAQQHVPITELIERAGTALARVALQLLGGGYGRRVLLIAGKGHNGDDGRVAARLLSRRGVRVTEVSPAELASVLSAADLVIDAAYGTGFRGAYAAPVIPEGVPVLAVDVPSGLSADTGEGEGAVRATCTVTFGALKPGLLLGAGPTHAGRVIAERIGLELGEVTMGLVEDGDVAAELPRRAREAHKWQRALYVLAGSPGMTGAAILSSTAALRSGAGMVRLGSPGAEVHVTEAVSRPLPAEGYAGAVLEELARCRALVLGPGLGQHPSTSAAVRQLVAESPVPVVLDADGLNALGKVENQASGPRLAPLVVTPHEGEFVRLTGEPLGPDRVAATRALAAAMDAVVLLKGSTTVIAAPSGEVRFVTSGSARLATAGTGDVLSGVLGAFIARGLPPLDAAALAAHVHGRAAGLGPAEGLVAGDLPLLVSAWLSELA